MTKHKSPGGGGFPILWVLVACLAPVASSQVIGPEGGLNPIPEIRVLGSLSFPPVRLEGRTVRIEAERAPTIRISYPRVGGFHVDMRAGPLENGHGRRIPARALAYRSLPGTVVVERGTGDVWEPRDSGRLDQPVTLLSGGATAQGVFLFEPDPAAFVFEMPASAYVGTYRGVLTFSLVDGP